MKCKAIQQLQLLFLFNVPIVQYIDCSINLTNLYRLHFSTGLTVLRSYNFTEAEADKYMIAQI